MTSTAGQAVQLKAADSHALDAWRVAPAGKPRGAVVVIQEVFGVNRHIRAVAAEYAAEGYLAIAPALFDRIRPQADVPYAEVAQGIALMQQLSTQQTLLDLRAAVDAVADAGKVGVVGYCWGGTIAFLAAARLGLPAVSYYGGRTVPFLHEKPHAPLLLHFGEDDPVIPPADVRKHHEALPGAEIHIWPAGHGFNCDQRADYNATVAVQALQRTLAFLANNLA